MTFAAITPALIIGAFAERIKFSAVVLFIPLWVTFVYFPIAHMVWYWAGPDAIVDAAKALAAAADGPAKEAAQAKLDEVLADAGQVFLWGAIDFAGGTVVHINAGIAGLVGALLIGKRIGYRQGGHAAALADPDDGWRLAAVGRLVRLQRRIEPRSQRRRCARHDQHLRRHRGRCAGVDVRRMDGQGQALAARPRLRLRRRSRRGHARVRLLRSDGRDRARPRRRRRSASSSAPR